MNTVAVDRTVLDRKLNILLNDLLPKIKEEWIKLTRYSYEVMAQFIPVWEEGYYTDDALITLRMFWKKIGAAPGDLRSSVVYNLEDTYIQGNTIFTTIGNIHKLDEAMPPAPVMAISRGYEFGDKYPQIISPGELRNHGYWYFQCYSTKPDEPAFEWFNEGEKYLREYAGMYVRQAMELVKKNF